MSIDKKKYQNKKVLILGLGLNQGGVGSARFFAEQGSIVKVTDLKTKEELKPSLDQLKNFSNIEYVLGQHQYKDLNWADLIIRNQAIKPNNPYLKYALEKGKQVEMDLGIFLKHISPAQIIGITGTKGKSTTASVIYEILRKACPKPWQEVTFAGNIGTSVLEALPFIKPSTLVILELSSFQLDAFSQHQISPKWAIITNIFPDHLNWYSSMDEYVKAKRYIAQFQTPDDMLFIRKGDSVTDQDQFLEGLTGRIKRFSTDNLPSGFSPQLLGEHNLENFAAAFEVASAFQIDKGSAIWAMEQFQGVEFRLQLVKEWAGIKIYNDSAATNPDATIQALKSLPNSILICGGVDKELNYQEMAQAINQYAKSVYFLEGTATKKIRVQMPNFKSEKIKGTYNGLEKLIKDIKIILKPGDVVLFSPGAASFNLFQNEFDRGRKFNQAVEKSLPNKI